MFDHEKNYSPLQEEEADSTAKANERQKDAADAAKTRIADRETYERGEVGVSHPHEEKDTAYMDEKPPKVSVIAILKYIGAAVIIFVFALLFYRICAQREDFSDKFVWTEEAIAVYQETGSLTVWTQNMSSFTLTLERDENNLPTYTYQYIYSPYSEQDADDPENTNNPRNAFEGVFFVSDPMYIEETEQLIVTLRVNRTADDCLIDHYNLSYVPSKKDFIFTLTDGLTTYADYSYITFEKNSYFYYRLVFDNIPYSYAKSYEGVTENDIVELSLNVYYGKLFHESSPIAIITVANNMIVGDAYKIKKALPAELPADLTKGYEWVPTDEE